MRWIGPDVSFFEDNRRAQALRSPEQLCEWSDDRRDLAARLGKILSEQLGWKSPIFLPKDQMRAILAGPRPLLTWVEERDAIEAIEEEAGQSLGTIPATFGELIDQLQAGAPSTAA